MNTMSCGCKTNGFIIEYCPTHNAAPDMYKALKRVTALELSFLNKVVEEALAKAEGKE